MMCGLLFFFQIFSLTENGGGKWASLTNFGFKPFGSIWAHFKPQSRKGSYVGKLHLSLVQTQWPNFHRFSTSNVFLFSWLIFHLVVKITVNIQHFGSKTLHFQLSELFTYLVNSWNSGITYNFKCNILWVWIPLPGFQWFRLTFRLWSPKSPKELWP